MIKAIETTYNGYRFRSRLEARWAVFFDTVGLRYQYEPEGFEIDFYGEAIRYLPDFYFPDLDVWGEVKGAACSYADSQKLEAAIDWHGPCENGIILFGDIPSEREALGHFCFQFLYWLKGVALDTAIFDFYPDGENRGAPRLVSSHDYYGYLENFWVDACSIPTDFGCVYESNFEQSFKYSRNVILAGFDAARKARFEHGETPVTVRNTIQRRWFG